MGLPLHAMVDTLHRCEMSHVSPTEEALREALRRLKGFFGTKLQGHMGLRAKANTAGKGRAEDQARENIMAAVVTVGSQLKSTANLGEQKTVALFYMLVILASTSKANRLTKGFVKDISEKTGVTLAVLDEHIADLASMSFDDLKKAFLDSIAFMKKKASQTLKNVSFKLVLTKNPTGYPVAGDQHPEAGDQHPDAGDKNPDAGDQHPDADELLVGVKKAKKQPKPVKAVKSGNLRRGKGNRPPRQTSAGQVKNRCRKEGLYYY